MPPSSQPFAPAAPTLPLQRRGREGAGERAARSAVERVPLVLFALGDDLFAADVQEVDRVLRPRALVAVPRLPHWVAGMLEHAGRALPVIDLRARFELPPAPSGAEPRILVIGGADGRIGVLVDRVAEVAAVDVADIDPSPALFRGLRREYVRGIVRRDGRLILLLHGARLLTATERLALAPAEQG